MSTNSEMANNLRYQEERYQILMSQPHHGFTRIALVINKSISTVLFFPVFPIQLVTTFIFGILTTITFGLFAWVTTVIWILFLGPLLGLSLLWLKIPLFRPILLIPGVLWANASNICATIFPAMGEWDARKIKLDLCGVWPLSWRLLKDK